MVSKMNYTYAGIGSREAPKAVCLQMTAIAKRLAKLGLTLHSGGAKGADSAFEHGAVINRKIFLPWDGFEGKFVDRMNIMHNTWNYLIPPYEESFIEKYHPRGANLSRGAKKLMSRNSYQVLGEDLKSPVDFVLCWTKDGKATGGTGQALRIAENYGIRIFNLKQENDLELFGKFILQNYGETK